MFPNLRAEISRRGLKNMDVAAAANISQGHFSLKLNGKYDFSLTEAIAIKKFLDVQAPIEELFAKTLDDEEAN